MTRWGVEIGSVLSSTLFLGLASSAWAGDIGWTGTLRAIEGDDGTGIYTGGVVGSSQFSGSLHFSNTCGASCTVNPSPPEATSYAFSDGAASVRGLGKTSLGSESSVHILNEEVMDQSGVEMGALFGINLTVGQTLDKWAVSSVTSVGLPSHEVVWGLTYVYVTTDPFINTNYTSTPPPNPDVVIWELFEDFGDRYAAVGKVDTLPEPGVASALCAGVAALSGLAGRSRRTRGMDER